MRRTYKKLSVLFLAVSAAAFCLTGCHGSKDQSAFTLPETFDGTKQMEITFWAKNETNKTQTQIYEKAIADFE